MMYGFTYRGRHSSEFGLVMKTKNRPVVAPLRLKKETVPYRDGEVDYSNAGGRVYYDSRTVSVTLTVVKPELRLTHGAVSKIVSWLSGWYGELIFDDMPYTVWLARPEDFGNIELSLRRVGKLTVKFRCKPFNRDVIGFRFEVGAAVSVGSEVPINYREGAYLDIAVGTNTLEYYNIGDAPVRPSLIITGPMSGIAITLNDCTLKYNNSFNELTLNCEEWTASADGVDVTSSVSGDYPELLPGMNFICITAEESGALDISGYPNYLYGAGGVSDA